MKIAYNANLKDFVFSKTGKEITRADVSNFINKRFDYISKKKVAALKQFCIEQGLITPRVPKEKFIIARNPHGISLNGYEFVLTQRGYVKKFNSKQDAVEFLNEKLRYGLTEKQYSDKKGIYIFPASKFSK